MKRTLKERVTEALIHMGRKNKLLRIFAIAGLAVSFWFFRIAEYMKKGTKRFACAVFALLCFMVGSSFAYPVFQEENGFVAEAEAGSEAVPAVSEDATITLAEDDMTVPEDIPVLDDDVMEDYDAELHGMETADKYSLSEILKEDGDEEITQTVPEEENSEISFSEDDWKLVLINKQHPIPDDYEFTLGNIKTIKGTMQCDERIIDELLAMMQDALEDGVTLAICSPYRDFNYQQNLFNNHIKDYMKRGMSYMDAYTLSSQAVTVPGASEHQIGLAIDIVSDDYVTLDAGFADTDAGRWLAEHSWEYGFILRYPLGREYITGIEFEPWHFRYVGKDAAGIITEEGISLEEFWDKYL